MEPLSRLAAAARSDERLIARGLTDAGSMEGIIWPAFRDDVAPWASLDYAQDVSAARLMARLADEPPERRPAVAIVSNPALFDRAGMAEPFEVAEPGAFPPGWLDPGGRWLPVYVQPIVAIHNGHRCAPPRAWHEMAELAPAGRLVLDDPARMLTSGPALAELSSVLSEPDWRALVAGIAARGLLVADNERAVLDVSTGSCWLGLANWNVARRIRPGSPVRHVFLQPTPCVPGFGLLVRDAAGQALGRLFLAWLSSDRGQRAYAASGRIPARPDVPTRPSLASVLPGGVEPLFGSVPWLAESDAWAARFRELIDADRDRVREGKLR